MDKSRRRYYEVAGITLQVESDLPIRDGTFHPKFHKFEVQSPGEDVVVLRHHFELPQVKRWNLKNEVYNRAPWVICRDESRWIYLSVPPNESKFSPTGVAVFTSDHDRGEIYNIPDVFERDSLTSLTLFPTDQILLARLLADRQGCLLHSCGVILNGLGLLFVGHSEAGKSTMVNMLAGRAEILCDDRMIVRQWNDQIRIHGTWSHGDVPIVSGAGAPLPAAYILKKSDRNRLTRITDRKRIIGVLLGCLIKPLCTTDWWDKMLSTVEILTREIRWYDLEFDKTGGIADLLSNSGMEIPRAVHANQGAV